MVALVSTVAYLGLEARAVEVQCQVAPGLPAFRLVGLPDKAVGKAGSGFPRRFPHSVSHCRPNGSR